MTALSSSSLTKVPMREGSPGRFPDFVNDVYLYRSTVRPISVPYWLNIIISQPVRMKSTLDL